MVVEAFVDVEYEWEYEWVPQKTILLQTAKNCPSFFALGSKKLAGSTEILLQTAKFALRFFAPWSKATIFHFVSARIQDADPFGLAWASLRNCNV